MVDEYWIDRCEWLVYFIVQGPAMKYKLDEASIKYFHELAEIIQFTHFCRNFVFVAKYAFSQAPSSLNFSPPGSATDSRTGPRHPDQGPQGFPSWASLVSNGLQALAPSAGQKANVLAPGETARGPSAKK